MKRMNKKAVEPITITLIIIGIVVGLYLGNQAGLFSVSTPATPDTGALSTSVNKWYYDEARAVGTHDCQTQELIKFRTYSSGYPPTGAIAHTNQCGAPLIAYGRADAICLSKTSVSGTCPSVSGYTLLLDKTAGIPGKPTGWLPQSGACLYSVNADSTQRVLVWYASGNSNHPCNSDGWAGHIYDSDDPDKSLVSTAPNPSSPSLEVSCGISPIKDVNSYIYTCEGGNVIRKYCGSFGSEILDTCSSGLPCEFTNRLISGVAKNIVKCGGDYKPNLKICSTDTKSLFTTDSAGYLTTKLCGVNNYSFCSNGVCANCLSGYSWCEGTTVKQCISNTVSTKDTCTQSGFSCLQGGNPPYTNASCSSSISEGSKICGGTNNLQPMIFSVSQRAYINNGPLCRTSCVSGVCSNECSSSQVKCELGIMYNCNLNDAGNKWNPYFGNVSNSQCYSAKCTSNNLTCSPRYTLGYEFCSAKQRQKAVSESGNLLSGGVVLTDISGGLCNKDCQLNNVTHVTYCMQESQCAGKEGQVVCKDGTTKATCNALGDLLSNPVSCTANNTLGFCNGAATPAICSSPQAACTGTFGCSGGKIMGCDANGYFTSTQLSDCNLRNCSLTSSGLPSSSNSKCNDDCGSTGKSCVGNQLKTCNSLTVTDSDNKQWIFDNTKTLNCIVGCSNGACTAQKSFVGKYCDGTKLMESYNDATNIAGGGISLRQIADCTLSCQGTAGSASCTPIRATGKYCSGTLGKIVYEAVTDSGDAYIKDGGIKIIINVQTCELDCMNGACTTNCNGNSECDATDGKVHTCSSTHVIGAVSINCNNGCSEVNSEGKCNQIRAPGRYCTGLDLWEATLDASKVEDGGILLQKVLTCQTLNSVGGCTSGPPATCLATHTLGKYCGGTEGKVLMEAVTNTNLATGFVGINTIRTCALSCRQNTSSIPTTASCETNCDGATECSNGVVKYCDTNKELGATKYACTSGCSEVNSEGYCSPKHALGKFCGTGSNSKTLYEAVTDNTATLDGNVKINVVANCLATCTNTGTNNAQCSRYKEIGLFCEGSKLMESKLDTGNSAASIPYGGVLISTVKTCPAECNEITTSAPTTAECILDCNPNQASCKSNAIWSCTSDGLYGQVIDDCGGAAIGCSEITDRCKDECPVKTMDICKLGDSYRCLGVPKSYTNVSQLRLINQENCSSGCESGTCIKQCTESPFCYSVTGNLHTCTNGIRSENAVVSCKQGCDSTANQCINECTPEGKVECAGANSRTCTKNLTVFSNRDYFQYLWKETSCGNNGCNPDTGLCTTECTPGVDKCATDGFIHSCNSNSELSIEPINRCNEKGCDITTNACNQECTSIGFRCSESDSVECYKDAASDQLLERTTACGQLGCGTNGRCKGSIYKNSFDCAGFVERGKPQEIFATDSEGKLIGTSLYKCIPSVVLPKEGLNPYCQPNVGVCTFCEKDSYYCVGKELFQCDNGIGEVTRKNILYCDAGCGYTAAGSPYCDEVSVTFGPTSFSTGEKSDKGDINLGVTLKGSSSENSISDAVIDAYLNGTESESKSGFVGQDGKYNIQFLQKSKGKYTLTLTIKGYSRTTQYTTNVISKSVYITDSFIVSPYASQTIVLLPSIPPKVQIKVENPNTHSTPEDVTVSSSNGITVLHPIKSKSDPTLWDVTFSGVIIPGQYTIGFKPSQSGVTDVIEQTVDFEIVKPALIATLNNPDSTTSGKREYKLQISGPKIENGVVSTGFIQPDVTPKVTMTYNNGQSNALTLLDSGGGSYLISPEFVNDGAYTINVEASKAGYDSIKLSKIIQVSASGTAAPPATDGSGATKTNVVTSGGGILGGTSGGMSMYFILGIGAVIAYLIFTGRKRR